MVLCHITRRSICLHSAVLAAHRRVIRTGKVKQKMKMRIFIPTVIMVVANLAYVYWDRQILKENREKEIREKAEIDIIETVFRWEIGKHLYAIKESQGSICISTIRDLHRNIDFINRFSDLQVTIKQADACTSDFKTGVWDKETNRKSIQIFASGVRWERKDSVVVGSGYSEANLSASGGSVFVVYKKQKWIVIGKKLDWISKIIERNRNEGNGINTVEQLKMVSSRISSGPI